MSVTGHRHNHAIRFGYPLWVAVVSLLAVTTLHAHRPFEITSVARLQHGRLELTVIISPILGNLLVRDPAQPEAPQLDAVSIEHYRARLLALATGFYEVRDGDTVLKPERITVGWNKTNEPEFSFIYSAPAAGPLQIRVVGLVAPPPEGTNVLRVFDDNEQMLGAKLLIADGPDSQLSVPLPTVAAPSPGAGPAASTLNSPSSP